MFFILIQAEFKHLENTLNNCICEYCHSFWKNIFKTLYFCNQRHLAKLLFWYQLWEPFKDLSITLALIAYFEISFTIINPRIPLSVYIQMLIHEIYGVLIELVFMLKYKTILDLNITVKAMTSQTESRILVISGVRMSFEVQCKFSRRKSYCFFLKTLHTSN